MIKAEEKQNEIKIISSTNELNYNLLKLRNKIVANNTRIKLNNLHIFTMDILPT